ncbi:hypothetical protein AN1250.2 [Aspergillus nidulans FGSC A4]|uniref:DUF3824 domain-containing protein n=1 Tax=Emericella nidulans (strain FGSC A4 / ATCC 38163 / CBS 112.46 / NRRL 194 / M139) TaxID=227321 RepID=Q5BDY1_EMENI|nr:hypothetical protein [Aspergillus nidulans FGSC A4]EAA65843.1 hypothetical protein AN1250.2 [Aspergillus nidulans FGSC A4]CBF87855.1 TPA: hypothetical protein ANIA_01250 [Aspergillus nidulans FGSC A4]|eukprot:XP_658854.1 hypothetical protein AN1250.2 [Aspergillus nidulans FGSC A4]
MAYYDSRPPYPPAEYPETPYYYGTTHGGSHSTAVMPHANPAPTGGTRDAYYRDHPARDAYEYGHGDYDSKRSRKSRHKAHSADHYDDPYDGYESRSRRSRHHDERRREKYDYSPSSSRSPPRRRRSLSERALGALGLGAGAASAGSKHRDNERGRSRGRHHRSYSYSPSPSRGGHHHHRDKSEARIAQAVKAALAAGAIEAFRARKEPGEWSGAKGKRVLTAALAAGGTDGIVDRNPDKHSKRHILESTLAGLATNRVVNGSRSRSRSRRRSRSRSRSKGRGKAKDAAIAGILAAAGKEAYDRFQKSHSRSRPRHRSNSRDSYDSYGSRPRHKRSKSVSDYINKGMAALGLDDKSDRSDKDDRRRRHHRSSRYDDYSDDGYSSDEYYRRHPSPPRTRHSRDVSRAYYLPEPGARAEGNYDQTTVGHYSRPGSQSTSTQDQSRDTKQIDSDTDDSTDDRKKLSKLNRETLWATGLAAAATIHAAHSLTESMEKHKERAKQVREGEMSREEARHRRRKNQLSDIASVGVAALGINSAIAEWRNFDHKRRERAEMHKVCKERSKSMSKGHSRSNSRSHFDSYSRPQRTQSLNHQTPRTIYPDEVEENWSVSDRRSMRGRSPGVMI